MSTPRKIAWAFLGIAVMSLILVGVVTVVKTTENTRMIRQTQIDNTYRNENIERLVDNIDSCTNPEGECYRRDQARTKSAVMDINRVTVYAATCGAVEGNDTPPEILSCIEGYMEGEKDG